MEWINTSERKVACRMLLSFSSVSHLLLEDLAANFWFNNIPRSTFSRVMELNSCAFFVCVYYVMSKPRDIYVFFSNSTPSPKTHPAEDRLFKDRTCFQILSSASRLMIQIKLPGSRRSHGGFHCCPHCNQCGFRCRRNLVPLWKFRKKKTDDHIDSNDITFEHSFVNGSICMITAFPCDCMQMLCFGNIKHHDAL